MLTVVNSSSGRVNVRHHPAQEGGTEEGELFKSFELQLGPLNCTLQRAALDCTQHALHACMSSQLL
jgi:hypothetical protein